MGQAHKAYKALLGKTGENNTYLPLWMHLEDTAAVMRYMCEKKVAASVIRAADLSLETFCRVGEFLARTHDIGKCTPRFVAKIALAAPYVWDTLRLHNLMDSNGINCLTERNMAHALQGEILLRSMGCPDGVSTIVGAHHGKPSAEAEETYKGELHIKAYPASYHIDMAHRQIWQEMQKIILDEALIKSGFATVENLPILPQCAQVLLCGLLIQADWIASNQYYFPLLAADEDENSTMYPQRFNEAINKLQLTDKWQPYYAGEDPQQLFISRFGFAPNPIQSTAVSAVMQGEAAGGLLIIEAQMGIGKTEAALAAAEILAANNGSGGLFFGLPTQATTNGMFARALQWAANATQGTKQSIRLAHSRAELNEDYTGLPTEKNRVTKGDEDNAEGNLIAHSWFAGNKRALLADFVIGTVDTALMAAVKQKYVMLRHLGLCGKVVVIDECHAYDAYMSRYLLRMLQWLGAYRVPTILLSATLPNAKKTEMLQAYSRPYKPQTLDLPMQAGYPLITWVNGDNVYTYQVGDGNFKLNVKTKRLPESMLVADLREHMRDGGCTGIIVNTVKRAQEIALQLKNCLPEKKVCLYHAQYIACERVLREDRLIKLIGKNSTREQRNNVIVVGTQVLEQSLDIDFDYLVTDLCPMDLLLQRIGRLHRHKRARPVTLANPICAVLGTRGEYGRGSSAIYGEWLLQQTEKYLPNTICLPADIPQLVNRVYETPTGAEALDDRWIAFRDRTEIKEEKATSYCLGRPHKSRRESGNSIVGLLDVYIEDEKMAEATVRDGMSTVDVLVMWQKDGDHVGFAPWTGSDALRFDAMPSEEEAKQIARQRLRLPFVFGLGNRAETVINILAQENRLLLPQWQDTPWLKGELIMLLNEKGERDLCGYQLKYDKETGLQYERIGD